MSKLGMIALLASAGSAFANDFEAAQNAGFDSTKGPATLIAAVLTIIGVVVWWMWKNWKRTKMPLATATAIVATVITLHAGDFANAADSGYGLNSRMYGFGGWLSSVWSTWWGNMTASFGEFTPPPSATPRSGGNGSTPPRQQN